MKCDLLFLVKLNVRKTVRKKSNAYSKSFQKNKLKLD